MSTSRSRSQSFARSISSTGRFVRRQVWLWPILAAVILGLVGWLLRANVESSVKHTMAEDLKTICDAEVKALRIWLTMQKENAAAITHDGGLTIYIERLAEALADESVSNEVLAGSPNQTALRSELRPWLKAHDYSGYVIVDLQGTVIAAQHTEAIGRDNLPIPDGLLQKIAAGETVVTHPFHSAMMLEDEEGNLRGGLPTMFVVAPVRNTAGEVIAAMGLRIRPEHDFTEILAIARPGESGETFAFNRDGLMLSNSRFDDELKQIGLLADREEERSLLTIQLRDPQVNMAAGARPALRRSEQPLTEMVPRAVDQPPGHDVDGYRDYRGVPVIGAWQWLDDYDFGVATEIDLAEAYRPLYILRWTFWGLFALLGASAVAIFIYTIVVARLQTKARKAALEAKELGQYTLDEKLGAGGMGVVYRGHHAMLRRPTAVKLLDPEKTTDATAARFEREVQATAALNHPNTIAIYDYGRTPEGVFYYAMELLEGMDLDDLVKSDGPQPPGRVAKILMQICASLSEAHTAGLIHRDIKPGNVVLNERGGIHDFVKVLDFGLVKAIDGKRQQTLTAAGSFTGTPLYLSPEGINTPDQVDARSDIYAVGAVGCFLLTGKPLFDSQSVVEVIMHQVNTAPVTPSERMGREIDSELEQILMQCLAKDAAERPQSAKELQRALRDCACCAQWTDEQAAAWWQRHRGKAAASHQEASDARQDTHQLDATMVLDQGNE